MPSCDAALPRGRIEICRAQARGRRARPDAAAPRNMEMVTLVVDASTRAREHVALRSMFAARKRIFVDLLNWNLPVLAGRFAVDRRDGPAATYLIVARPDGEHLASARLLPHLSAGLGFAGNRPAKSGAAMPGVAEMTHFCLSPEIAAIDRRRARDQLLLGLVEHTLAHKIDRLVGTAERRWARSIAALGWVCHRLGAVQGEGPHQRVAITVDVDATAQAMLARAGRAPLPSAARRAS